VLEIVDLCYPYSREDAASVEPDLRYEVRHESRRYVLVTSASEVRGSPLEVAFSLEAKIESALIDRARDQIPVHAGGVARNGRAWILAGDPNAGKTTTTFHLVEAGFSFVCEEIAIIDSTTHHLHPFLQTPSLDGRYLERRGQRPGNSGTPRHGRFERLNEFVTRYLPDRCRAFSCPVLPPMIQAVSRN
jgi:hypothetical protein